MAKPVRILGVHAHPTLNDDTALPNRPHKGRGSMSNRPPQRFSLPDRYAFDDGWTPEEREQAGLERQKTIVGVDAARKIITTNDSPDVGFGRTINPYKGCEHGCIFCFARPSHVYLDLSPGLDFETRIFRKPDAARLLREELSHPKYKPEIIMLGINADAWQPTEKTERSTRGILEVLYEFRHPVTTLTRSTLILRDLDILSAMAAENLVTVGLSITTLDRHLARVMEPRAATPSRRLDVIRALSQAGVPTGVMVAPVIPGLTDHEIEGILKASAEAGARRAGTVLLRLPHEVKILFEEWLREHFPDRTDKVLNLIRQCRDGKLNSAKWGTRMSGSGTYAAMLMQRFEVARRKYGLDQPRAVMDFTRFRGGSPQMELF